MWLNPLEIADLRVPDEEKITAWGSQTISDKQYRELARVAWEISPTLVAHLPAR